jgi:hypothetical protein
MEFALTTSSVCLWDKMCGLFHEMCPDGMECVIV